MQILDIGGYAKDDVMNILHLKSGERTVKIRYDLLNRHDIKIGELSAQQGKISFNSDSQIKLTGYFTFKEVKDIDWLNDRVKPVFMLRMSDGNWIEWSLGILLISAPERTENSGAILRNAEAYDISLILVEDKFDNRYRIAAGTKITDAIVTILNSAGIWKINIANHDGALTVDKEFETGTSKMQAIEELLRILNYTSLWVDKNGYFTAKPYVLPTEREVDYSYRTNEISVIHPGALQEIDTFNVPNVWIVTASTPEKVPLTSRYVNDVATSKTSTVSRGRKIVSVTSMNDIYDQATLDAYVKRRAYDDSCAYDLFRFSSALMPHHTYQDLLYINHDTLGVAQKYTETSWEMDFDNQKMLHNTKRVIQI